MLQNMRENFTGTFAIVILGIIGLSFVFFGLNYSFIGSSFAAKVAGEEISAGAFEQRYQDAVQRNPQLATVDGELRLQIRRSLLDQMVAEQLIENYLNDNGYRISDEQIKRFVQSTPEFQSNGSFSMDTYRAYLAERGMDPTRFERLQRDALRRQQLQLSIAASALVTPAEYRRYLNLMAEQRIITVAAIDTTSVAAEIVITDDMVTAYYDDNPSLYLVPESADVEYIQVSREDVAEDITISDAELLEYYEDNRGRYLQDEQRRARHILILFGDDESAAEAQAADVLARLEAGEAFSDLAAELSADTLTAAAGGDFGTLTRSQYQAELASVIFTMSPGELTGPVRSDFGLHVIQLDEVLEPGPLPLEQVRNELMSELREDKAEDRYRDLERSLSDALFDSADLQAIAAATGLEIQMAAGMTRAGGQPFGANQAAIDAIFDDNVLTGGQVSEVIELDANSAAIFRVATYNEATRLPLESVRGQVIAALQSEQADMLLSARAEQMLEALDSGDDFNVAADMAGFDIAEPQLLTRASEDVDRALLFDVFAAAKPTADTAVFSRIRTLDGGYIVYSLNAVLPGRPESIPLAERDEGKLQLAQQSGVGDFQAFVRSLHDNADVVINDDVLAADDLFQ